MYARNTDAQASPPLHIAAPPQDAELERVKALLGRDYRHVIRIPRDHEYTYTCITSLLPARAEEDLRGADITEFRLIEKEDGDCWELKVQFNAPAPTPEPLPVSRQIPACVGIAEPGTSAAMRGTPDYASHVAHLRARALAYNIVARWMEAERFRQTHSKYNVWDHGALLGSPTHSAWVRLPDFQRVEAIHDKRLLDGVWWYAVDISTDPARTFLKWFREDELTLATPTDADKARDVERRKARMPKPQTPHEIVQAHIGQRIHIPTFDAGAGPARGCDYVIAAMANAHTKPDTALVRFADGSTAERSIGVIYGEITHWAREGKAA